MWLAESFSYGSMKPMQIAVNNDLHKFYENIDEEAKNLDLNAKYIERLKSTHPNDYNKILDECDRLKINIVCFGDENYPEKLRNIEAAPLVLYYVGDLSALSNPSVAVVGTRRASAYGLKVADKIARELTSHNITVISGCAEGIDMQTHRSVTDKHGNTMALLGTSLEKDYPSGSGKLKRQIINCGGAVISEYAPHTKTSPWMFPVRNRLIVGLSDKVVIVQSPKKSGAMITAGIACDQGKEVFCVPPSDIFDARNDGVKKLLRDGANILLGIDDILDSYRFSDYFLPKNNLKFNEKQGNKYNDIPQHLKTVFDRIDKYNDLDQISKDLNIPMNHLLPILTELEIMGMIEKVGQNYQKC